MYKTKATFSCIICVHILVLGSEMPPLEPIDRSEISLFAVSEAERVKKCAGRIAVPNTNVLLLKKETVRKRHHKDG